MCHVIGEFCRGKDPTFITPHALEIHTPIVATHHYLQNFFVEAEHDSSIALIGCNLGL